MIKVFIFDVDTQGFKPVVEVKKSVDGSFMAPSCIRQGGRSSLNSSLFKVFDEGNLEDERMLQGWPQAAENILKYCQSSNAYSTNQ